MRKVGDEQTIVVNGVALQANAVAAGTIRVQDSGVVDADVDLVADGLVQAEGLGIRRGDVVHKAAGWIGHLGWD